jgi:hypothetical protein
MLGAGESVIDQHDRVVKNWLMRGVIGIKSYPTDTETYWPELRFALGATQISLVQLLQFAPPAHVGGQLLDEGSGVHPLIVPFAV